ncbi:MULTISPECIES: UDP-N-acetylmuramoyl-L-alanyl-D-glutamate--2,6-diaminopimelate ligase [unclassified Corynebacterium]|uniref:UDP-N-acetylmuramoyl-L-alanyl-D-glutamate--2, 6-diaminopimelate ligase n=1 Tax=unclassified Corynebacterium TaxID=2624378 RepID=UPI001EF6F2F6|nr:MULTISPECIES: UDP-N-acetylmuramoyl-L-alanyl-D-glutamate--2,6-diaminopimelate ligase [unclassified Corynebacterium]MCG7258920.1 UDP-N-acetylmuramoyl-L-alanyl-D-glutamate--2,6-diaminopimelate ligase [Corynebacterium sp. ACRQK]MCG7263140.1 UDP-N-acetylmuramoyl-L-alanyl-D-glutamate--2,6-diaminopimelate ligase [Corynebacterium sp. ACRQL]
MTSLKQLAEICGGTLTGSWEGVEVTSAAIGSQDVQPGGLFCAVPGQKVHGATFAADSKAAAVLTDAAGQRIIDDAPTPLPCIVVDDVREWMGPVSAEAYGHPARQLKTIGITGTSGKTTTSYLVEKALLDSGLQVGLIGTTGTRINGQPIPTSLTTPEAPTLQALLARMVAEGTTHLVMEVSSHALQLGRVRGVHFDVVAFTNLSQDHLDFHPTMEDYFQAKALLFESVEDGAVPGTAVICCEDEWGERMRAIAAKHSPTVTLYPQGGDHAAETTGPVWSITSAEVAPSGRQHIHLSIAGGADPRELDYSIGMAGSFNQANSLVALACIEAATGDSLTSDNAAVKALTDVQVPGRMQLVEEGQDFLAMVDYAHKPGAVQAVLGSLHDYLPDPEARIGIVLGAGGNRDHDKRAIMGRIAAELADAVFVTDDNPRDEEPSAIREAIYAGAREGVQKKEQEQRASSQTVCEIVPDRAEAIGAAVAWARPGDAVVVAGKGHEKGQLVAGTMHPFDDVEELTAALKNRVRQEREADNGEGRQKR